MANGGKYAWHRYWQLLKIEFTWFRTLRSVTTGNASIMPSAIEIDWIKTTLSHTHWSARFIIHMDRPQLNIECRYLLWFPLGPPCDSFLLLISFAFVYLRKSHKHFDCVPKFISGVFFGINRCVFMEWSHRSRNWKTTPTNFIVRNRIPSISSL